MLPMEYSAKGGCGTDLDHQQQMSANDRWNWPEAYLHADETLPQSLIARVGGSLCAIGQHLPEEARASIFEFSDQAML